MYRNNGDGTFTEEAAKHGTALMVPRASRGVAFGDLFNDGNVDIVVNNLDGKATILRNSGNSRNNWLTVRLIGGRNNRSAVGAIVRLTASSRQQTQVVQSGDSYLSQSDKRLHFGLGSEAIVKKVEVAWPDGTSTDLENVKPNQFLVIRH